MLAGLESSIAFKGMDPVSFKLDQGLLAGRYLVHDLVGGVSREDDRETVNAAYRRLGRAGPMREGVALTLRSRQEAVEARPELVQAA